MKLQEAIEILTDCTERDLATHPSNFLGAIKLGIEALKRLQKLRDYSMTQVDTRLPGETE